MKDIASATTVLIVYYSRFGAVQLLAERVAEGARRVRSVQARLLHVDERLIEQWDQAATSPEFAARRAAVLGMLISADALVVGAPSYFGSMASTLKRFFEDCLVAAAPAATDDSRPWRHYLLHDKVGAAFTASGTPHGGNEETLHSILTMLMHLGLVLVTPGQGAPILENESAPYGATAITGADGRREPTAAEQEEARNLGERVAETTVCLKLGRLARREGEGTEQEAVSLTGLGPPLARFEHRE